MSDPDSFKAEKAKVIDYIHYFNQSDIEYLDHALKSPDSFYKYTGNSVQMHE